PHDDSSTAAHPALADSGIPAHDSDASLPRARLRARSRTPEVRFAVATRRCAARGPDSICGWLRVPHGVDVADVLRSREPARKWTRLPVQDVRLDHRGFLVDVDRLPGLDLYLRLF